MRHFAPLVGACLPLYGAAISKRGAARKALARVRRRGGNSLTRARVARAGSYFKLLSNAQHIFRSFFEIFFCGKID